MDKVGRDYPEIAPAGHIYGGAVRAGDTPYITGCVARGTEAEDDDLLDQLNTTLGRIVATLEGEGGVPS